MRRGLLALAFILCVAGCGDSGASGSDADAITSTSTTASAVAPTHRLLSETELTEALVGVQNLPPGYSQNPPSEQVANKTFCDYVPPFEEEIKVTRDFTKGIGLSSEMLGVGLRQFASADQAREAFEALTEAFVW